MQKKIDAMLIAFDNKFKNLKTSWAANTQYDLDYDRLQGCYWENKTRSDRIKVYAKNGTDTKIATFIYPCNGSKEGNALLRAIWEHVDRNYENKEFEISKRRYELRMYWI